MIRFLFSGMSYPFFMQSISKFREIGSIIPSSRFLVSSMCEQIDFRSASLVVELGPGTGVMTRWMLSKMSEQSRLVCIELNPAFSAQLSTELRGTQVSVVQGSAEDLSQHLQDHGGLQADYIVSSLPLYNIPIQMKMRILRACNKNLKVGGQFIQYQYSIFDKKTVQRHFDDVKTDFVLMNFPPAFVYTCTKQLL